MAPRKLQHGVKPPPGIKELVIRLAGGRPRPTNRGIIEDVERRYEITISTRTVGRYCDEAGVPPSTGKPLGLTSSGLVAGSSLSSGHRKKLLSVLHDHTEPLGAVAPISRRGQALLLFWLRPLERDWPVPCGSMYRVPDGLSIRFHAEQTQEWGYLQQHFEGDPMWEAVTRAKEILAQDIKARINLYDALLLEVQGNVRLSLSLDLRGDEQRDAFLHPHYVMFLFDQVFSRALGMTEQPQRVGEFRHDGDGRVSVRGFQVVVSQDPSLRDEAIQFFVSHQAQLARLEEAQEAAKAYSAAVSEATSLAHHVGRILLSPGLPPSSTCDSCRLWA